jgi:hypothetical protein
VFILYGEAEEVVEVVVIVVVERGGEGGKVGTCVECNSRCRGSINEAEKLEPEGTQAMSLKRKEVRV